MTQSARIPPQDIEVEAKVLGAMLQNQTAAEIALEVLTAGDFYKQAHAEIFDAIQQLSDRNEPIDQITVTNELKKSKKLESIGSEAYLLEIIEGALTPANIKYHAEIVKEKSTMRALIDTSTGIINRCFDDVDNVDELLDEAEKRIFEISEGLQKEDFKNVADLLPRTFEDIERYGKGDLQGTPSGFSDLDAMTSGFQRGDFIILAARPSMGKTALALAMAANAAIHGNKAIGIFSLEMSRSQLVQRLLCAQARIDMHKLRTGRLPHAEFAKLSLAAGPLSEAKLFIDDSTDINVHQMRAKARRLKAKGTLDMVVVDYLQLMQPPSKKNLNSREQEIAFISRSLKGLAKDLDIPVLALSQLARRADQREGGRPQLSDLRESGAIEQDADVVLFIYREEVYNKEGEEGKAEIIIGKQRNGPVGSVPLTWIKEYASFEAYSPRAEEAVF